MYDGEDDEDPDLRQQLAMTLERMAATLDFHRVSSDQELLITYDRHQPIMTASTLGWSSPNVPGTPICSKLKGRRHTLLLLLAVVGVIIVLAVGCSSHDGASDDDVVSRSWNTRNIWGYLSYPITVTPPWHFLALRSCTNKRDNLPVPHPISSRDRFLGEVMFGVWSPPVAG
eukprot:GFYU01014903.1.p2 GENE.GFYU01014903.1~~GFYU01014903.1.p2  ORF type:complete len:172 (+),score=3.50 GFYU01014903.1:352-867(+)